MCSAFLWSGSPNQTHKAKVAWEDLCVPKEEGGLGIRRLHDSSMVFAMSLIWKIFSLKSSLWVSWIQQYLLRQNYFWDVKENMKGSWVWRKLLRLRSAVYDFIRYELKNGHTAYFWFDNWLGMGKLIDITGVVGTCHLGVARNARVSDAVSHSVWNVRGHRSRYFHTLYDRIQAEQVPLESHGSDMVLWRQSEDDYKPCFSASKTWKQIRSRKATVFWNKVVWFTQAVPRFSFIVWLAVKNRLSTGDRMRAWGIQQACVLCGEIDETRDHVFFAYPYSFTVWGMVAHRLTGAQTGPDWITTLQFISMNSLQIMDRILLKMKFQTSIYHLWKERNERRHHTGFRTVDQLVKTIAKTVRNRITSLRYRGDHKLTGLMCRWSEVSA